MRLRAKVFSGFLVLALMLSLAGAWSIHELHSTSTAVNDLLAENYRSIHAARMMIESLEREDSGVLLLLLGRWDDGRAILAAADSAFGRAFRTAAGNVTIPGEDEYVAAIESSYAAYKAVWERPIVDTAREGDLTWYFESTHRAFLAAKDAVSRLIDLNSRAMYDTASGLRQGAERAVMPGIVAMAAALVFSLLFSYFVNIYIVSPIVRITDTVRRVLKRQEDFDVRLDTGDELAELAESIRTLASRARPDEGDPVPAP